MSFSKANTFIILTYIVTVLCLHTPSQYRLTQKVKTLRLLLQTLLLQWCLCHRLLIDTCSVNSGYLHPTQKILLPHLPLLKLPQLVRSADEDVFDDFNPMNPNPLPVCFADTREALSVKSLPGRGYVHLQTLLYLSQPRRTPGHHHLHRRLLFHPQLFSPTDHYRVTTILYPAYIPNHSQRPFTDTW